MGLHWLMRRCLLTLGHNDRYSIGVIVCCYQSGRVAPFLWKFAFLGAFRQLVASGLVFPGSVGHPQVSVARSLGLGADTLNSVAQTLGLAGGFCSVRGCSTPSGDPRKPSVGDPLRVVTGPLRLGCRPSKAKRTSPPFTVRPFEVKESPTEGPWKS